jgi:hypothetical protein
MTFKIVIYPLKLHVFKKELSYLRFDLETQSQTINFL